MTDTSPENVSVPEPWKRCDCLDVYQPQLNEINTYMETALVWNPKTDTEDVRIAIVTKKWDSRNKRRAAVMIANYCPLCGTAYKAPATTEATDERE